MLEACGKNLGLETGLLFVQGQEKNNKTCVGASGRKIFRILTPKKGWKVPNVFSHIGDVYLYCVGQLRPASQITDAVSVMKIIHVTQYRLRVTVYRSVSQPPGRSTVPGPGINYVGSREVLLEFIILVF